jgi:hypothetical protein
MYSLRILIKTGGGSGQGSSDLHLPPANWLFHMRFVGQYAV